MPAKNTNSPNDITRYEVKTTAIRTLELHHRPTRERGFLPSNSAYSVNGLREAEWIRNPWLGKMTSDIVHWMCYTCLILSYHHYWQQGSDMHAMVTCNFMHHVCWSSVVDEIWTWNLQHEASLTKFILKKLKSFWHHRNVKYWSINKTTIKLFIIIESMWS